MENVKLTITPAALKAIAHEAIERKTGARGLRSIMENILLETMYELPTLKGVREVIVDKETIEKKQKPTFVFDKK